MPPELQEKLREWISKGCVFVVAFFAVTLVLWVLWERVGTTFGLPHSDYWRFVAMYVLIRGILNQSSYS